jgi:hypothetical protein
MTFCENPVKCDRVKRGEAGAVFMHFLAGGVKKLTGKEGISDPLAAWANRVSGFPGSQPASSEFDACPLG